MRRSLGMVRKEVQRRMGLLEKDSRKRWLTSYW